MEWNQRGILRMIQADFVAYIVHLISTWRLEEYRPRAKLAELTRLERNKYKIRNAFAAKKGCSLFVADSGQLEIRILAELTKCKSMMEAFVQGEDFRSRTAMGMYDYIAGAERKGEVLLEKPADFDPNL